MISWGLDTGISRNACALARAELVRGEWIVIAWKWQGSTGSPLRIEHMVAPEVARLWATMGQGPLCADAYYIQEVKRGLAEGIADLCAHGANFEAPRVRVQGGELRDVYSPTRRLVHQLVDHERLVILKRGKVWTSAGWIDDDRTGERITAGIKAVQAEHTGGKLVVSMPEEGSSHHDEAVAAMRALFGGGAAKPKVSTGDSAAYEAARLAMRSARSAEPLPRLEREGNVFRHARAR